LLFREARWIGFSESASPGSDRWQKLLAMHDLQAAEAHSLANARRTLAAATVPPWIAPRERSPSRLANFANWRWTFLKKRGEFRLFSSSLFHVSSTLIKMNIQP